MAAQVSGISIGDEPGCSLHSGTWPQFFQGKISSSKVWCINVWNRHTDLISSASILAVTTCLLAEKIFQNFPQIIPRLGRFFLNYTGLISLNSQIYDCHKSWCDWKRLYADVEMKACIQTAAKVFVKCINVLLTTVFFSASVAALGGFPQIAYRIYAAMQPFALSSLVVGISGDIWDYHINEQILHRLKEKENHEFPSRRIASFMKHYFKIILNQKKMMDSRSENDVEDYGLASRLVAQLDYQTVQSFQEHSGTISQGRIRLEVVRRFDTVKDSLLNRQSWTKSNLTLLVLGYLSMAICRAYPDSLIEMAARWSMSVLYTDELIRYKLFQADIAEVLSRNNL